MSDLLIEFVEWICSQIDGYTGTNRETQNAIFTLVNDALLTNGSVAVATKNQVKTFTLEHAEQWAVNK